MAVQYSTAVRNALLDAIETATGASAKLRIYTGSAPANCAAAATGAGGNVVAFSAHGDGAVAQNNSGKYKRSREMFAEELRKYWESVEEGKQAKAAEVKSTEPAQAQEVPAPFVLDLSSIITTPINQLQGPEDIIQRKEDDLLFVMSVMLANS